jgi:hypothetical protein
VTNEEDDVKTIRCVLCLSALIASPTVAIAQRVPVPIPVPVPDDPAPDPDPPAEPEPTPAAEPEPAPEAEPDPDPYRDPIAVPEPPPPPPPPRLRVFPPEILLAPTGRLLPAGVIYSRSSLDTGGGLSSDLRVGLGDVAEFAVSTTDLVRARQAADDDGERIWPYLTASFKVGVAEHRLVHHFPAVALGLRKSFERDDGDRQTQFAELHLVASKELGERVVVHAGGVFWDAKVVSELDTFLLHDRGVRNQLRPFGGLELRPLDDAQILVDLYWAPEFCYACTQQVDLTAILSWGVRYEVSDAVRLESGVRVPDIQDANLLDAQIFGQVTFLSHWLRRIVHRGRP